MFDDELDFYNENDFENECDLCGHIGEHSEDCVLNVDDSDIDYDEMYE